jgi:hypothetical protein
LIKSSPIWAIYTPVIGEELKRQIDELDAWMAKVDWEAVRRDLAIGPQELAKIGWSLTGNSPVTDHARFLNMIRAGRAEECQLELEKHYEDELPRIRRRLVDQFQKGKRFWKKVSNFTMKEGTFQQSHSF